MIFRIEFKRDGSVTSCRPVESHLKDGGLVVYVEADDAVRAIAAAKTRFDKWREAKRLNAKRDGQCLHCFKRPVQGQTARCGPCNQRARRETAARRAIEHLPPAEQEAARSARAAEIHQRRVANAAVLAKRAVIAIHARSDRFWDDCRPPMAANVQSALRQCLRALDRDPVNFRNWLLAHISSAERRVVLRSKLATSRAEADRLQLACDCYDRAAYETSAALTELRAENALLRRGMFVVRDGGDPEAA